MTDSDDMPLDGEADLSASERKAIRRMIRDQQRASWAWQMVRVYVPWITTLIGALGAGLYWIVTHFSFKSPP